MDNTTHREKRYFLYHQNKKFGNKNYHFQQEFVNLDDVFQYLHKHDKYVLKSKWSLPQQLEKMRIEERIGGINERDKNLS